MGFILHASRTGRRARAVLACGLLLPGVLAGAPTTGAPELLVEAPPELERQAVAVRALGAGDWVSLLNLLGLASPGRPVRVVLADERSALAARAPSWVSGYALPALDTVVLFPARVPSYPVGTMEALVRHELAHMLLARATGGRSVPRWFNEGAATVAAREWGVGDGARVAMATIGRGPRTLDEVDAAFLGDAGAASRGYAVSAALVRYLLRRHGDTAVARILAGVAAGHGFDDAFAAATGESTGSFARAYFRRETVWNTWVPFATSTAALWMGITALALLAVKRRRDRDAALRAAWDAEEHPLHVVPTTLPDDDPKRWN